MNSVSIPAIPAATQTKSGIVTTGLQSFDGLKCFYGGIVAGRTTNMIDGSITYNDGISFGSPKVLYGLYGNANSLRLVAPIDISVYSSGFTINSSTMPIVNNNYTNSADTKLTTEFISILHGDLLTLMNESMLIPGQKYRITDYVATTTVSGTSADTTCDFDIIITAATNSTFFNDCKIVAKNDSSEFNDYSIKYEISNDNYKYKWVDPSNGKGVIYNMIDYNNNECPYDFINIAFNGYTTFSTGLSGFNHNSNMFENIHVGPKISYGKLSTNIYSHDREVYELPTNIRFCMNMYTQATTGVSTYSVIRNCYIGSNCGNILIDASNANGYAVSNINIGNNCSSVKISDTSVNISNINIGNNCSSVYIHDTDMTFDVIDINVGNGCSSVNLCGTKNKIEENCCNITIDKYSSNNYIGRDCSYIRLSDSKKNILSMYDVSVYMNESIENIIDVSCSSIYLNDAYTNKIGASSNNIYFTASNTNTIAQDCANIKLTSSDYNNIGIANTYIYLNTCDYNMFNSVCGYIKLKNATHNTFDNGCKYILTTYSTSQNSTSYGIKLQNCYFGAMSGGFALYNSSSSYVVRNKHFVGGTGYYGGQTNPSACSHYLSVSNTYPQTIQNGHVSSAGTKIVAMRLVEDKSNTVYTETLSLTSFSPGFGTWNS